MLSSAFGLAPAGEHQPPVNAAVAPLSSAVLQPAVYSPQWQASSAVLFQGKDGVASSAYLQPNGMPGELSSALLRDRSAPVAASIERRPLKIAHVGPCLYRGGAEQQLIDLARFMDPACAVLDRCLVVDANGIDQRVASDLNCSVEVGTRESVARAMEECDVVLSWGLSLNGWCDEHRPRRAVSIYIAHGDSHWTRDLLVMAGKTVDHVVAVSQRVCTTTCQGFPTTVILNGVDTARLATTRQRDAVRAEFGYTRDDFVVGFVGRFSPEKRPELLLQALELLPRKFKGILVGWGPLQAQLLEEMNTRIPNRCAVRFADRYLGDYYSAFDAFTLLSTQEGFALVFLEAMFCGLPVVATPVGAVPEVITHNVNGIVVDGSPDSVAEALLTLDQYPDWARGVAESARRYSQEIGHARRMAREYEQMFASLVAARRESSCFA